MSITNVVIIILVAIVGAAAVLLVATNLILEIKIRRVKRNTRKMQAVTKKLENEIY